MALSFYSNYLVDPMNDFMHALEEQEEEDLRLFHDQPELADALLGFFEPSETPFDVDTLFNPSAELLVEPEPSPQEYFFAPENDYGIYNHLSKRQRINCNDMYDNTALLLDASYNVPELSKPATCGFISKPMHPDKSQMIGLCKPQFLQESNLVPDFSINPMEDGISSVPVTRLGASEFLNESSFIAHVGGTLVPDVSPVAMPGLGTVLEFFNDSDPNIPEASVNPLPSCIDPVAEFIVPDQSASMLAAEKETSSACLSQQSIAARERRRKISKKTQELGRLVPGGNKMNTAEMLEAAHKYVRFLQAQVGILQQLGASSSDYQVAADEELQILLTSPSVQEKLYGESKCIVPKQMVSALAEDSDIISSPLVSREFRRFVESLNQMDLAS